MEAFSLCDDVADRGVSCHRSWKKSWKRFSLCDEAQIVAFRATDHGRNRGSVPQLQCDRGAEFGDEMKAVGQFLTHFASFFALLRLCRS